jgi:hypothetical protein
MKKIIIAIALIAIIAVSCRKNDNTDTDIVDTKQDLYKSNLDFINSDWILESTGDSLKDQIIGLWLSNEVIYDGTIRSEYDSLFTWVIESTGKLVKRNNSWGDNATTSGTWEIDANKKYIFYSYKEYAMGGTIENYRIVTDTINIKYLTKSNLSINKFINYFPPRRKIDIKFNKLK